MHKGPRRSHKWVKQLVYGTSMVVVLVATRQLEVSVLNHRGQPHLKEAAALMENTSTWKCELILPEL